MSARPALPPGLSFGFPAPNRLRGVFRRQGELRKALLNAIPSNVVQTGASTWRLSHPLCGLGVKGCYPIFQARRLRGEDEAVNNMLNFSSETCPGSHTGQSLSPKRQVTCPGKLSSAPPSGGAGIRPLLSLGDRSVRFSLFLGHHLCAGHSSNWTCAVLSKSSLKPRGLVPRATPLYQREMKAQKG